MFTVYVKGETLKSLKKAVGELNAELNGKEATIKLTTANDTVRAEVEVPPVIGNVDKVIDTIDKMVPPVIEASAPIVEAPMTPVTPIDPNAELDAAGIPWDVRIHTVKKTKMKKEGTWKIKKGSDKQFVATVLEELRNNVALAANPPVVPPAPIAPTPIVIENPITPVVTPAPIAPTPAPIAPTPAPTPVVAPVPMSTGGHTLETFKANFPMVLGNLISEGKVGQGYVNQLKEYFGVTEIWNVSDVQKEELFNNFVEHGFVQKV